MAARQGLVSTPTRGLTGTATTAVTTPALTQLPLQAHIHIRTMTTRLCQLTLLLPVVVVSAFTAQPIRNRCCAPQRQETQRLVVLRSTPQDNDSNNDGGNRVFSQDVLDEANDALTSVGWASPSADPELTSDDPFVQSIDASIRAEMGVPLDELLNPAKVRSTLPLSVVCVCVLLHVYMQSLLTRNRQASLEEYDCFPSLSFSHHLVSFVPTA